MKDQIENFVVSQGIDIEAVRAQPYHTKSKLLAAQLFSDGDVEKYLVKSSAKYKRAEKGLIVVKPELNPYTDRISDFLSEIGFQPQILPTRYLDRDEWLRLYGYMLNDYPDVVFLYICHRALGLTPIIFDHLPEQYYLEHLKRKTLEIAKFDGDLYRLFDQAYCGNSLIDEIGTLRGAIGRKYLIADGFEKMTGRAVSFDIFDYFRYKEPNFNLRVFNGVHVPNNREEGLCDLQIFGI